MFTFCSALFIGYLFSVNGFIPHPALRLGGQAGNSITHTELVQLGFIRSLTQFFLDEQTSSGNNINPENFQGEHTIDQLYQLIHPEWTKAEVNLYSYPLKSVIDMIQERDALVDLDPVTKNLPSAHFDGEAFRESNQRIMHLRKKVIEDANDPNRDLTKARLRIGELLHTLQDFYSHSNWIEMGKTEINDRIGIQDDIGPVADANQPTCTNNGCTKIQTKCNLIQKLVVKKCPMEYYDCKNNILTDINDQGLLTSGYVSDEFNEKGEPVPKPTNVEKCSHGSVMDASSHTIPIGGINKDTVTPVYSPHYHLHFDAAKLAVDATANFFNGLRKEIGDVNFDRLFVIHPSKGQIGKAKKAKAKRQQFHFLTSTLSVGLSSSDLNFEKTAKQRIQQILATRLGVKDSNAPTYDLSGNGVDTSDVNIHSGSLLIEGSEAIKRRRLNRYGYRSPRQ